MAQTVPVNPIVMDSRTLARHKLIGFLCNPPQEKASDVKKAIRQLASDLDCTYEEAWRWLLTSN